ncbi:MAG TPA: DUF488 family protein [Burkholderiales bacterium]|nr:DUF488 family protein [Burkholderiales bacterium]
MAEARRVALKCVYDTPAPEDGMRVLVDRLWPRGLSRRAAAADLWLKEAAPSPELRKWFGHRHARWAAFRRKYQDELAQRPDILRLLKDLHRRSTVTLLFATRDTTKNHAVVLRDLLERKRTRSSR